MTRSMRAILVTLLLVGCTGGGTSNVPPADVDLFHEGVNLLYHHKHPQAEAVFRKLTAKYPDDVIPLLNLAIAQLNQVDIGNNAQHQATLETLARVEKLAPDEPRGYFLRGILARHLAEFERARGYFEAALKHAPGDADVHYWLGITLRDLQQPEAALPHLEVAVEARPNLESAWYVLFQLYQWAGREADAERALDQFEALRDAERGTTRGIVYTEMGVLGDGITGWVPRGKRAGAAGEPLEVRFAKPVPLPGARAPFAFVDADMDGTVELWGPGQRWQLGAATPVQQEPVVPDVARTFAVGDIDEDGRPDVVFVNASHVVVLTAAGEPGSGSPSFVEAQRLPIPNVMQIRLVDIDLESDLDLVGSAFGKGVFVAINQGRELMGVEESAGLMQSDALERTRTEHVPWSIHTLRDMDEDGDADMILRDTDRQLRFLENGPQWRFRLDPAARGPRVDGKSLPPSAVVDLDADGHDDFVVVGGRNAGVYPGVGAGDASAPRHAERLAGWEWAHAVDVDLDGAHDLIVGNATETSILRNDGTGGLTRLPFSFPKSLGVAAADVDGDLDLDLVLHCPGNNVLSPDSSVLFVRNETDPLSHGYHALKLYFGGDSTRPRYTNRLGIGARYEVRTGNLAHYGVFDGALSYHSRGLHTQGLAPRIIGLGPRKSVGTLLVRWPDQVVQSERDLPVDQLHVVPEVQRKQESCPVLFTWDGERYRFITDFLGGAGLGVWVDRDTYEPFDPTETVRIPPGALAPIQGEYRLSVMEPMEEITYLDALELRVVAHPADVAIYPDEKLATSAAFPATGEALAIRTAQRAFPVRAAGNRGQDVTELLRAIDDRYPDAWAVDPDLNGIAEPHTLSFEFGDDLPRDGDVRLFLFGWIEYPSSHVNFAAWQSGRKQHPPSFHWRRGPGQPWQLLGEHIGFPAGFPKTMVLDVSEAVQAGATEFRIDTDMEIYWDQVFAARVLDPASFRATPVPLVSARLRFGGYPRWRARPGSRLRTYHYGERQANLDFKRFQGPVTEHGDVRELITAADDRFALIATGDELFLRHDARAVPTPPAGWTHTFLLRATGYVKSMDPLGARPRTVAPFPSSTRSTYPPAAPTATTR